ncbi:DUF1120 domain-containing protein [Pseudomonas salomonii]|uniref:DUF1120 domain-containing protein n=1 Tax=Pseudomonas salomonii TaxID=191391 RepID=A0A7Y8GEK3_9PSED|nr:MULTISPECIES: DUF1120 domain-containing protein [Pseudomonas]NWF08942.1 DUF1120 domain-containing protein [Pseudomonas salomonii]CRM23702.1 P pilus assembly protein, pilin FimA [Pseudomonas sp. 58 R 3]
MKTPLSLLSSALLLAMTSSVLAASSVDLTVKGLITPSACTPSLPGDVDFGKIAAKDLNQDTATRLENKTVQLSVNCDAATLFAIHPLDNRAGTALHGATFGLGLINENQKLGKYQLVFSNPVAETASTLIAMYNSEGQWTELLDDEAVAPNDLVALGSRGDSGWAPHPIKDAVMDMTLYTSIAPASSLTLTSEVAIDGSATFEVRYL